jgi:hypothetical protein
MTADSLATLQSIAQTARKLPGMEGTMKRIVLLIFALGLLAMGIVAPLAAQGVVGGDVIGAVAPAAVIGAAIALTELWKRFASSSIAAKLIWLPALIVGIVGAILTTNPFEARPVVWNALTWSAMACYVVLIVKRLSPVKPVASDQGGNGTPAEGG